MRTVSLPLVLYNMPQCTKIEYAVDTVRRASEIPNVIGLKDSSGDLGYLEQVIAGVSHRPDFGVLIGPEEQLVDGLRAGTWGGVNGGANLFPRLYVDTYEAARRGDWAEAERLQKNHPGGECRTVQNRRSGQQLSAGAEGRPFRGRSLPPAGPPVYAIYYRRTRGRGERL